MKATDIRKKSPEEIKKLVAVQQAELRDFRFGMSGGHSKNVKKAKMLRKDIARMHTILSQTK